MSTTLKWKPSSWKDKKINPYDIGYRADEQDKTNLILSKINRLPPLVTPTEISDLRNFLKDVAAGRRFIWQCGDCAELFDYCEASSIKARTELLFQLGLLFTHITGVPALLIGRIAGQYGKPRNGLTEKVNGVEIQKFHGDVINSYDVHGREPDPERLLAAYFHSSSTLNYMRSIAAAAVDNSSRSLNWCLGPFMDPRERTMYDAVVSNLIKELGSQNKTVSPPPIFTSHEALFLHYEQALTRPWEGVTKTTVAADTGLSQPKYYNSSAHFVWIGDKTRQLDGAHVEYFRGLENPIGIKVGPSVKADELVEILSIVNPNYEIGKVVLISRLGKGSLWRLGSLIQAVQHSGNPVIWQCDPMHGNTRMTKAGIRTRDFSLIVDEIIATMDIHRSHNSRLSGVHLETSPDDGIEECVGGSSGIKESDLGGASYKTKCDPRFNQQQALEVAFLVGRHYALSGGIEKPVKAKI